MFNSRFLNFNRVPCEDIIVTYTDIHIHILNFVTAIVITGDTTTDGHHVANMFLGFLNS